MLKIRKEGGRSYPYIECDVCGKPIEDGRYGLASFHENGRVKIIHKNSQGFKCDDGESLCTELELFLFRLCHNTKIDLKWAEEAADDLEDLP